MERTGCRPSEFYDGVTLAVSGDDRDHGAPPPPDRQSPPKPG